MDSGLSVQRMARVIQSLWLPLFVCFEKRRAKLDKLCCRIQRLGGETKSNGYKW